MPQPYQEVTVPSYSDNADVPKAFKDFLDDLLVVMQVMIDAKPSGGGPHPFLTINC